MRNPLKTLFLTISYFFTITFVLMIFSFIFLINPVVLVKNFTDPQILFSIKLSFLTGLTSTFLVMLFAIPIGYSLSRFEFFGSKVVKAVIDLPIAFPQVLLGLCLLLFFGLDSVVSVLDFFNISVIFSKLGIVVAQFFTALPFSVKTIKSTFDYIDEHQELVSYSLGHGYFTTFTKISLPLAKNGLLAATVLAFTRSIGSFGAILILAGGTYMKTETLPITLYLNLSYGNIDMAISAGVLLILISFATIYLIEKIEVKF